MIHPPYEHNRLYIVKTEDKSGYAYYCQENETFTFGDCSFCYKEDAIEVIADEPPSYCNLKTLKK